MIKKRRGEKCFAPTFPIWMFFYLSFGITPIQDRIGVFVRVRRKQTISRSFLDKMSSCERRHD